MSGQSRPNSRQSNGRQSPRSVTSEISNLSSDPFVRVPMLDMNSPFENINQKFNGGYYYNQYNANSVVDKKRMNNVNIKNSSASLKTVSDLNMTKLTKRSVAQLVNDMNYLRKLEETKIEKISDPNVIFKFKLNKVPADESIVKIHSFILLARSNWFRRSWRKLKSTDSTRPLYSQDNKNSYEFKYESGKIHNFNFKISAPINITELKSISDKFEFEVESSDENGRNLLDAFKELSRFLYSAECEIDDDIAPYLVGLASALDIESLRDYIINYFIPRLSQATYDDLFYRLEISHVYNLTKLKDECIKIINSYPKQVISSTPWKRIEQNYPELVLEIFYKNDHKLEETFE